ncbi:MAG: CoB--CoM heterodisulfide reductase iron-sulfur subunit A family protein, partial [Deltaproteobacteria bacterium]|nr:CoB--CoM heterodisulfide reductase iron-sulfur subunit A family protein [Deltaproteobacteria bacterium]
QCSWVHAEQVDLANEKALDLIAMAVRRAATLEPLEEKPYPVVKHGLVVGGGLAGLTAAESMAEAGYGVTVVERSEKLGGMLAGMRFEVDGTDPGSHIAKLAERVKAHPKVEVLTQATVKDMGGHVGHFESVIETQDGERDVEHGAVIVATGAREYKPEGEYLYGQDERVMTQREFEEKHGGGALKVGDGGTVMVQCVGSREPEHPYCSRTCCTDAMRNAIRIKEASPDAPVTMLYRDIRTYGLREELYSKARRLGVQFIRFTPDEKPEVIGEGGSMQVRVRDPILDRFIVLKADLVLLSAALRPDPDAPELSRTLKLPLGQDGFFLEAHMKLRPLDFANDGVFLCGLAHGPKALDEIIIQARGAAGRAGTILGKERMYVSGQTSIVDGDHCAACLTCVRVCPYNVPEVVDGVAVIDAASCQGCGACASACPRKAISIRHIDDRQITAKVENLYARPGAK